VVNDITVLVERQSRFRAMWRKQRTSSICFAEASKAFGRLDILINNAGVYRFAAPSKKLLRMSFIGNSIPTCWVSFWQRAKQ